MTAFQAYLKNPVFPDGLYPKRKGTGPKGARRVQPGTENNRAYFQYNTHLGYFSDSISAVHSSYPLTTAQVENVAHIMLLI